MLSSTKNSDIEKLCQLISFGSDIVTLVFIKTLNLKSYSYKLTNWCTECIGNNQQTKKLKLR